MSGRVDRGDGGTGIRGTEAGKEGRGAGVEGAVSGVEGTGSGDRRGGNQGEREDGKFFTNPRKSEACTKSYCETCPPETISSVCDTLDIFSAMTGDSHRAFLTLESKTHVTSFF